MNKTRLALMLAPISITLLSSFSPAEAQGKGQTTLKVYNASNTSVAVYITVSDPGGPPGGFLNNVSTLPYKPPVSVTLVTPPVPTPGVVVPPSNTQGFFNLGSGKVVTITTPVGKAINGNVSFGSPPVDCPNSVPGFGNFPNGVNFAEFTLNNNTPAFDNQKQPDNGNERPSLVQPPPPGPPQELADISTAYGVNAKLQVDLYAAAGTGNWAADGTHPNVKVFANNPIGTQKSSPNVNVVGIFPPGCEDCTENVYSGCWSNWPESSTYLCRVHRPASLSGGAVQITFKGFYPVAVGH